ncbi:MAG TPA: sulfatase-like hydrolase/transferase, partial [Opitutus sp.]|nr:sulfatase-like hydrolase/transferase [Opitutus sp.]
MKSPVLLLRFSVIAACVGGAGWSASLAAEARGPEDRPNVVFILADDLGWRDLACYGNTLVNTPRIDSLARDGMRFTQAYAYPTCSPTRVSL